jgi:hypothetical protein
MKKAAATYPADDFPWPEKTVKVSLTPENLEKLGAKKEEDDNSPVELLFRKGTEPRL